MPQQTRAQIIAQRVYTQVNQQQGLNKKFIKEYGRICNRFPVLVMENGLAQALGFLCGKAGANANGAEGVFYAHLTEALGHRDNLLNTTLRAELNDYLRLTRDAMGAAIWYKRFAQGVLGVDATGETEDEEDGDARDAAQ